MPECRQGQEWGTKGDTRQDSPQPLHKESRAMTAASGSQESTSKTSEASATKSYSCVSETSNTVNSTYGSG